MTSVVASLDDDASTASEADVVTAGAGSMAAALFGFVTLPITDRDADDEAPEIFGAAFEQEILNVS